MPHLFLFATSLPHGGFYWRKLCVSGAVGKLRGPFGPLWKPWPEALGQGIDLMPWPKAGPLWAKALGQGLGPKGLGARPWPNTLAQGVAALDQGIGLRPGSRP